MLSLLKRKPKPAEVVQQRAPDSIRRYRQQNIKVSDDCASAFAALAEAQGLSKSALFEDMVAERLDILQRQGNKLDVPPTLGDGL